MRKWALLLKMQVNYVEDIIATRDTARFGMLRKEEIPVISDIGHKNYHVQADNHLDYLIQENWLSNIKRHGRAIKAHAKNMQLSNICVSQ